LGEDDSGKKPKAKNLLTLSLEERLQEVKEVV
jgi:hypothetical protein